MRIRTYKNAEEKLHTFLRRSKNVKYGQKTYEKQLLCKSTLTRESKRTYVFLSAESGIEPL